jgi:molybdopterin synthase sulfur carrier subunit
MKVKLFATYRDLAGCRELDIPAPSTAYDLLLELANRYGSAMRKKLFTEDGEISEDALLLINGRNIAHLNGSGTPLKDSDVASLFPMVAGG